MRAVRPLVPLAFAALALGCSDSVGNLPASDADARSGGDFTVFDATTRAFAQPIPGLSAAELAFHAAGDAAFEAKFVTGPAPVNAGLGPLFNNTSCTGCHPSDGRGRPPLGNEPLESMLLRVSLAGVSSHGGPKLVPGYGDQLQVRAIQGVAPEALVSITYRDSTDTFSDGSTYRLRVPSYAVHTTYIPLPPGTLVSPRVAPANFGLGLLEAVPAASIVALADEGDANGDGISGKANYVFDAIGGGTAVGRFGLKANTPNLLQQTAAAYNGDMGITTSFFAEENCYGQVSSCPIGGPDLGDEVVQATAFYLRTLGVPARRLLSDQGARRGEEIFKGAKCASCHVQTLVTGATPGLPQFAGQVIHPYTDLLVHDMGPGLADGRPDFLATGSEWRTAPLWGIGLTQLVNGHSNFLHDGRARSLIEAIMWHGGEGAAAREAVRKLSSSDRAALLRFLNSL